MSEPQRKVLRGDMLPSGTRSSLTPKRSLITPLPSPARRRRGAKSAALRRFVYQDRASALPPTTFKLCLMTTECVAVSAELATPKLIPIQERGVPSRKTPTKKPQVTRPQQRRMRKEGRAWRKMKEVPTVNGRTRPRATW